MDNGTHQQVTSWFKPHIKKRLGGELDHLKDNHPADISKTFHHVYDARCTLQIPV